MHYRKTRDREKECDRVQKRVLVYDKNGKIKRGNKWLTMWLVAATGW